MLLSGVQKKMLRSASARSVISSPWLSVIVGTLLTFLLAYVAFEVYATWKFQKEEREYKEARNTLVLGVARMATRTGPASILAAANLAFLDVQRRLDILEKGPPVRLVNPFTTTVLLGMLATAMFYQAVVSLIELAFPDYREGRGRRRRTVPNTVALVLKVIWFLLFIILDVIAIAAYIHQQHYRLF